MSEFPTATHSGHRPLYRHRDLIRAIEPRSIAIVGASERPDSLAARARANLSGFKGPVYWVNAKYQAIHGEPCYANLASLPGVPDSVIVTVGQQGVEPVLREAAGLGVGGLIVFAAGYAEMGTDEGRQEQERLARLAQESGVRLIGPNVVGIVAHQPAAAQSFVTQAAVCVPGPHAIGLVSQSGGISNGLSQAIYRGVSFSHTLSAGNSADVDCADLVAFLSEAPSCRSIALVFEGLPQPRRLIEAAELARTNGKALVVCKLGRSTAGSAAALSHTGFLAGSYATYEAALRRAGAIVVDSLHALIDTAAFFAKAPYCSSAGLAVAANSGGATVFTADVAEARGISMPAPTAATAARIREHIPEFGSVSNPCDLTAGADLHGRHVAVAEAFLADPAYGALLTPLGYLAPTYIATLQQIAQAALRHGKPSIVTVANEWAEGPGMVELTASAATSVFRSTEHALNALASWHGQSKGTSGAQSCPASAETARQAAQMLRAAGQSPVPEYEAKRILSLYGLPVAQNIVATRASEAVRFARDYPGGVAMKIESPDVPHKTDAGLVRLRVQGEPAVLEAYAALLATASAMKPPPKVLGVLVQPMVEGGTELMIGGRVDPHYGPTIAVGLGGVFVELLEDIVLDMAPVSISQALRMLDRIKGQKVLDGFRGAPAVDRTGVARIVSGLSHFISDHASQVSEFDVNPLICSAHGAVAVDGLIALHESI